MEQTQNLLSSDLQVDPIATVHLKETAMWAKFMAIVGLVLSILLGILALFIGTIMANLGRGFGGNPVMSGMGTGLLTVYYLFIAAIYFFTSLFLFRFATKMKQALFTSDQENFNASLLNLKLVYRIMGIIMIIFLSFMALALIGGIFAAAFMK